MRASNWSSRVWMRVSSALNSTLDLALLLLPFGRPGLRLGGALAAALACIAAFSSAVRTICLTAIGNERRCVVLISESVKKASAGTRLSYRLAKKRSVHRYACQLWSRRFHHRRGDRHRLG